MQEIVDEKKITINNCFICNNLNPSNVIELGTYKKMASNYAPEHFNGYYSWWWLPSDDYVIAEKYRFIKDLIAIL